MTVFISGGCKNGKSTLAERVSRALAGDGRLYYIATMIPRDGEDEERIRRHVQQRSGLGFETIEQGRELLSVLERAEPDATFLLDSVTALLANELFREDGSVDREAGPRTADELRLFAGRVKNAVFVSDFIYSDAMPYDEYTELYRASLALCDRTLAASCDTVAEVAAACCHLYKGRLPL